MKRNLSPAQADAARRLRQLWDTKKAQLGLTQEGVAERLGITQSAVGQYLRGVIPLNTDMILKFARLLGCPAHEISPTMADKFDVAGPVLVDTDRGVLELSSDEVEWVRMLRQLSPADRQTMRRVVAALAQPVEDPRDAVAGY